MGKIVLPLSVTLPRKTTVDKVFQLNLNVYRNAHYMILNQAKIAYKDLVWTATRGFVPSPYPPYFFSYTVYPGSNRAFDLGNVLPIVQKFTDDALIDLKIIKDDNYKVINRVGYQFGGVDPDHPRVELEIIGSKEG